MRALLASQILSNSATAATAATCSDEAQLATGRESSTLIGTFLERAEDLFQEFIVAHTGGGKQRQGPYAACQLRGELRLQDSGATLIAEACVDFVIDRLFRTCWQTSWKRYAS
jgi:hypothetical protein